jgi:hypothetical protein
MPLVAHTALPTFERLRQEGQTILSEDYAFNQDIRELHIGFLNMMPDAALAATERQFFRLVGESNLIAQFHIHPFTLESLPRSAKAQAYLDQYYEKFADLREQGLDALIITGANPAAQHLEDEPFWDGLCEVVAWAACKRWRMRCEQSARRSTCPSTRSNLAMTSAKQPTNFLLTSTLRRSMVERRFRRFSSVLGPVQRCSQTSCSQQQHQRARQLHRGLCLQPSTASQPSQPNGIGGGRGEGEAQLLSRHSALRSQIPWPRTTKPQHAQRDAAWWGLSAHARACTGLYMGPLLALRHLPPAPPAS